MEKEKFIPPEALEGGAEEAISAPEFRTTDQSFRDKTDLLLRGFCKSFTVEGKENLVHAQESQEDVPFIIASSHVSNLDAPAAVSALGDRLDIQITTESVLHGVTPQEALFRLAGKDHFSKLAYSKHKGGKSGVFNPGDFDELARVMKQGRSPWMAIHPFTVEDQMQDSRIGSVYLAHKTGSKIIPTALEMNGGSINMEGPTELIKAALKKADAVYHVGEVIDLDPVNVSSIEKVIAKRAQGEKITSEEKKEFSDAHKKLKLQADQVAAAIAAMLPESQRGKYATPQT